MLSAMARKDADIPSPSVGTSEVLVVRDGTEVKLRLKSSVSSASSQVDDPIFFEAVEPVVVEGVTVVEAGAEARGTIILAQSKRSFGRRGKLDLTIDAVRAVDGLNLRLRATKSVKGKEKYGQAGVVTILAGPFGFFVKGKDVEIPGGTEYPIYIDGDREIKSE